MSQEEAPPASALDWLEKSILALAGVAIVGVIICQGWQVYARYILNSPPSWTDPVSVTLMATAAMFGAAIGTRRATHFAFTSLADVLPGPLLWLCRTLAQLSMMAAGVALAFYGTVLGMADMDVKMAGAPLPVGVRFLPLAIGGALIALFAIEKMLGSFAPQEKAA